jgi:N-dimethylarginine dimethylaminohydrolase
MHRPGPELDPVNAQNHRDWLFPEPVDPARLRDQFDALVAAYRDLGVEVHLVEGQRLDRPNALFVRDLLFMTTEGAIVARPGHPRRRGEERAVAATLARMGVPILRTVAGEGTFDGASAMLVNPDVAIVGTSTRTNAEGADQVADQLARMGVRHVLRCTVPASQLHLDGVMAVVDRGLMVVNRWQMPFDLWQALEALEVRVVGVDAPDEVFHLGLNMVAVAPGRVVMSSGYPKIRAVLEHEGVEAIEVDTSEIRKAGGAMHCLTGVIRRDPIG